MIDHADRFGEDAPEQPAEHGGAEQDDQNDCGLGKLAHGGGGPPRLAPLLSETLAPNRGNAYLCLMDVLSLPPSWIVEIARLGFANPEVDFLCFGESDQRSPASAHAALTAALDAGVTTYADVRGIAPLRIALSRYLSALHARPVAEPRVQVTASGMTALNVALAATVGAGERVIVHAPVWPNIPNVIRLRGAEVDALDFDARAGGGFRLGLDRLARKLPGARALVLNSPNNPTGWTATRDELTAILELCRAHGVWLISDEVYSRLVYDGIAAAPSLLDIAEPADRVMVVNSFSKSWAMTGWRLGWLVLPEGMRDAVTEIVEVTHSGVSPFIQHGGVAALADRDFVARFRKLCTTGRALVGEALAGLDFVRYAPPSGAFYAFIRVEGVTDSLELARRLVLRHRVAVAPGSAFGTAGEGHLRICFAHEPERLRRALRHLAEGLCAERVPG